MRKLFFLLLGLFLGISLLAQNTGDYRTVSGVIGEWSDISVWERYNGASWVAATSYPNNIANDITIENMEFFEMNVDITIPVGGFLFIDDLTVIDLSINSGFTLTNEDSGNILGEELISVYGTYVHGVNGGSLPLVALWNFGSVLEITGMTSTMPGNLTNQTFKTINVNSSGMTAEFELNNITFDDLDITNTGSSAVVIDQTESLSQDITIGANGVLEVKTTGRLTATGTITNNGGTSNLIIKANNISSGSMIYNGSISGTYEQYVTEDVWHLIGIPVNKGTGATLGEFNPSAGDAYMRAYETANSDWGDWMTNESEQLNVGQGYEYWTTVNHTVSLTGTFNTGNVNLTMSSSGNQYNLLSNPYPCALDWESVTDKTNALSETIYFYANTAGTNGYAVYNGSTNTGTYGATQYIPPFQGFFVEQTTATDMDFSNSNKAHPNTSFYKAVAEDGIHDRIRLQITQDTLWSETVIVYSDEATNGYDRMIDTKMPSNNNVIAPEIYSIADDKNIMINGIGDYPAIIPLELDILEAGNVTLTLTEMSDMLETTEIQLEDRDNGNFYTLDNGFLGFSFDVEAGLISDRFFVHYSSTVGFEETEENKVDVYSNDNVIYVSKLDEDADIKIYNMMGQIVYEGNLNASGINSIQLDGPTSYYIVQILSDNVNMSRKLFIAQ